MAERMCPEMELEVMRLDALDHTIREMELWSNAPSMRWPMSFSGQPGCRRRPSERSRSRPSG